MTEYEFFGKVILPNKIIGGSIMIFGDQWICRCGAHNLFLRTECRECHSAKEDSEIGQETARQVIDRVYHTPHQNIIQQIRE